MFPSIFWNQNIPFRETQKKQNKLKWGPKKRHDFLNMAYVKNPPQKNKKKIERGERN